MSNTTALPIRTAAQAGSAAIIVDFADAFIYDMSDTQAIAAVGLLTLIFSVAQNLLESRIGKKWLMKDGTNG